MRDQHTLHARSDRLEAILSELDAHAEQAVRARVREAVAHLMEIHREALARLLELASDEALGGVALMTRLADDPVVGPLLIVHDLHPHAVEVRLARALDRLRAKIAAHGCRATLVGIDGRQARVRLAGGARLSDGSTLGRTLDARLREVAPELSAVVIDLDGEPVPPPADPELIQVLRQPPPSFAGSKR
jgi:hypothetical protein